MRIYAIFVIIVGLSCSQTGRAVDIQESYDKIDKHLSKKIKSDDVNKNLVEAERWLDKLKRKSDACFAFHRDATCDLVSALELLLSLKNILDPKACDDASRKIVNENDEASRLIGNYYKKEPERRIEKIVYHYAKEYYSMCHPDIVSPFFAQLDQETLKYLLNIGITNLLPLMFFVGSCIDRARELVAMDQGVDRNDMWRHQVTEDEVKKFLVQPCKKLEQAMGNEFNREISSLLEFWYDLDLSEYRLISKRRTAVNNCKQILKRESEIYENLAEELQQEELDDKLRAIRLAEKPEKPKVTRADKSEYGAYIF